MVHVRTLPINCDLGEGPIWHMRHQRLYLADVFEGKVFSHDFKSGAVTNYPLGTVTSAITCQRDGSMLLFQQGGRICQLDPTTSKCALICCVVEEAAGRFNDVIADCRGRVFAGAEPIGDRAGRLYRIEPDLSYEIVVESIGEPNGMGFSPDQRTFYLTDSVAQLIWSFSYDQASGNIFAQREFAKFAGKELPDGLSVDARGNVWVAVWGGRRVVVYSPSGKILRIIDLPTPLITSVCFAGEHLTDLIVTSAKLHWDQSATGDTGSNAGSVFAIADVSVGLPEHLSMLKTEEKR